MVLDVDTGIDDALALLYGVAHPKLDLRAVTCVSGNVALSQVVRNTCSVLDIAGAATVPIGPGADVTLMGGGHRAGHKHGANGLGDLAISGSTRQVRPDSAGDLLRDAIGEADSPVTLLALGPQTNIAMLVDDHLEEIAGSIDKLIFVGGRLTQTDEPAEFNVGHDPEAAAIVLGSGLPVTMYGLEIFDRVTVPDASIKRLAEHDHPAIRMAGQLLRVRHGGLIGDAGALVLVTNPELFMARPTHLRVGLRYAERGRTLLDPAAPLIDVVTAVEAEQASQRFVNVIESYAS